MATQCRKRATQIANIASLADALIAKAQSRGETLPEFLKQELIKLMEHNDSAPRAHRVSGDAALELLRNNGKTMSRQTFDRLIQKEFGRKWGSK